MLSLSLDHSFSVWVVVPVSVSVLQPGSDSVSLVLPPVTSPLAPIVSVVVSFALSVELAALKIVWLTPSLMLNESLVDVLPLEKVELPFSIVVPRSVTVPAGESVPVSYWLSYALAPLIKSLVPYVVVPVWVSVDVTVLLSVLGPVRVSVDETVCVAVTLLSEDDSVVCSVVVTVLGGAAAQGQRADVPGGDHIGPAGG